MPKIFAAIALLSLLASCTSKNEASVADASTAGSNDARIGCASGADCPTQFACLYPVAESCGAIGQCVRVELGAANCASDPSLRFCGCDGVSFWPGCVYGPDYYDNPVAHSGACFDGGVSDRTCLTDRDCPEEGTGCRYAIAEGCAAVGHCVNTPSGGSCAVAPVPTECACDGTTFAACLVPEGYAGVPVRHSGVCADGGISDGSADAASE